MGKIYKLIAQNLSFFIHKDEDNKFYATLQLKGKKDLKSPFFNTAEECIDWADEYTDIEFKEIVALLNKISKKENKNE